MYGEFFSKLLSAGGPDKSPVILLSTCLFSNSLLKLVFVCAGRTLDTVSESFCDYKEKQKIEHIKQ